MIDVEMQYIEFVRTFAHTIKHEHEIWDRVTNIGVKSQCCRGTTDEIGRGYRIAACEQRDLMTLPNEFLRKI